MTNLEKIVARAERLRIISNDCKSPDHFKDELWASKTVIKLAKALDVYATADYSIEYGEENWLIQDDCGQTANQALKEAAGDKELEKTSPSGKMALEIGRLKDKLEAERKLCDELASYCKILLECLPNIGSEQRFVGVDFSMGDIREALKAYGESRKNGNN